MSHWDDHADHPVTDWQHEVAAGDTRLGYQDWRAHQLAIAAAQQTTTTSAAAAAGPPASLISKTVFTFTVLHLTGETPPDLEVALDVTDTGHAVGAVTSTTTEPVPDDAVPAELRALDNDGEFFDDDLHPEREEAS